MSKRRKGIELVLWAGSFSWSVSWSLSAAQDPAAQEERIQTLEAAQKQTQKELAELRASLEAGASGTRSGYDDGFFVQSADGKEKLSIGALLQVNASVFERNLHDRESEIILRRMRLEFSGVLEKSYCFNLEPKFTEGEVELEEAWIGAHLGKSGPLLMLGRAKEPFSLEECNPQKHLQFVNFSVLNQFVPAEDRGITVQGCVGEKLLEYGAAVYNGTGGEDLNSDKDVALRLVLHPFGGFQFGGAITAGDSDSDIAEDEIRTEARETLIEFEQGSRLDGTRVRQGLEAAWVAGPFLASSEWIRIHEEVEGALGSADSTLHGWYVTSTYVLTGENASFHGVQPDHPLLAVCGGWGALELAARYSQLTLDNDLVLAGLILPESFPRHVRSVDVGLNWYLSNHFRMKLHLLRTSYETIQISGDRRNEELALLLQAQIHF